MGGFEGVGQFKKSFPHPLKATPSEARKVPEVEGNQLSVISPLSQWAIAAWLGIKVKQAGAELCQAQCMIIRFGWKKNNLLIKPTNSKTF